MDPERSILVVEDAPSWQMIYRATLAGRYAVEMAGSQAEARRKLEQRVFDLAIVDLRLVDEDAQNLDGLQVIQWLRDRHASTRVIVKSGYLTEEVKRRLGEMGVAAIFDKSASHQELLDWVAQAWP